MNCNAANGASVLVCFPYNTMGMELQSFMDNNNLLIFKCPPFEKEDNYVLPDTTPSTGMCKAKVRVLNQSHGHFDSADINCDE